MVNGVTEYLLGDKTLQAGGSGIIISGTVLSLQVGGQTIVVAGTTEAIDGFLTQIPALVGLVTTTSGSLGGIIASLGGFATPTPISTETETGSGYSGPHPGPLTTSAYNGLVFTGAASTRWVNTWLIVGSMTLALLVE